MPASRAAHEERHDPLGEVLGVEEIADGDEVNRRWRAVEEVIARCDYRDAVGFGVEGECREAVRVDLACRDFAGACFGRGDCDDAGACAEVEDALAADGVGMIEDIACKDGAAGPLVGPVGGRCVFVIANEAPQSACRVRGVEHDLRHSGDRRERHVGADEGVEGGRRGKHGRRDTSRAVVAEIASHLSRARDPCLTDDKPQEPPFVRIATATHHRRRLVRAPRLSRAAEDHPAGGEQGRRGDRGVRQLRAAALREREAARGGGGLGYAHGAQLAGQGARWLSGRARLRGRDRRSARCAARVHGGVRLCQRQGGGIRGRRLPRDGGGDGGKARRDSAGCERRPGCVPACLRDETTILHPRKAGEIARVDPAGVRAWYGIDPKQVPDFIALRGDPSDKIPGAKGVGEKTAASLLQRYATLEEMLADGKFPAQAEDLRLYKRIATMVSDAPLDPIPDMTPDWGKGVGARQEMGAQRALGAARPTSALVIGAA